MRLTGSTLGDLRVGIGLVGEQCLDQLQIAAQDGSMERRVPDACGIRVRPFIEQRCRGAGVAAVCGDDESARAIGQRLVHVCPRVDDQPDSLGIAGTCREKERGAAAAGDGVIQFLAPGTLGHFARDGLRVAARSRAHVSTALEQRLDRLRM